MAERIRDADIVLVNKVRLQRDALVHAKRLKFVAVAATGTDNIDLQACAEMRIVVSNIRNYAAHTVPEHTFALIFALRRSITAYRESVQAGRWQQAGQFCYFDYPIRDLAGSTIGIIGTVCWVSPCHDGAGARHAGALRGLQGGGKHGTAVHPV